MLSLQSFLREGRVVRLCWVHMGGFKPKGPEGLDAHLLLGIQLLESPFAQMCGRIDFKRQFAFGNPRKKIVVQNNRRTQSFFPTGQRRVALTLYLVGYPWLELLYFNYGIP